MGKKKKGSGTSGETVANTGPGEKKPGKKKKDNLSFRRTVDNNVFAMKLASKYSKSMVIAGLLFAIFGYFEWYFSMEFS